MAWAPQYITTAELDAYLRISDTVDDVELDLAVDAASRAVDTYCGRQFGQVASAEARVYTAEWNARRCRWVIDIDDLQDVTALTASTPLGGIDVFAFAPANAVKEGFAYTRLVVDPTAAFKPTGAADEVTITAKWGWTATPKAVKQATKLQASRFVARRDSPYGVAGSPDQGNELRLLARVDPDVGVSVYRYKRQRKVR